MCVSIQILPASWRAHRTKVERLRRTADRNQGGMHLHCWWQEIQEQGRAVCRQLLPIKTHMTGFSSASRISGCYEHSPKNRLLEQQSHELPDKTVMVFWLMSRTNGNSHEYPWTSQWHLTNLRHVQHRLIEKTEAWVLHSDDGNTESDKKGQVASGAMWCENQHPYVAAWWNYYKRFKEREEIYKTTRRFVQDIGITWTTMLFCRLFFPIRSACRVVSPNALAMAVWASGADTAFSFKGWAYGHWHNWNCYIILVTSCEERLRMC